MIVWEFETEPRPWPFQPLFDLASARTVNGFSELVGAARTTVVRAAEQGCTEAQADAWSIRAGLHPLYVYGWAWVLAGLAPLDQVRFGEGGGWRPLWLAQEVA